ncbi:hypothetical protein J2129_002436 [Methanofollis sp. W23]|nr:hypothetical protein [Methanofollis sp. W23]
MEVDTPHVESHGPAHHQRPYTALIVELSANPRHIQFYMNFSKYLVILE